MGIFDSLLGKKFPTPIMRPMAPFFIGGTVIFYGINSFAGVLAKTEQFGKKPEGHH